MDEEKGKDADEDVGKFAGDGVGEEEDDVDENVDKSGCG